MTINWRCGRIAGATKRRVGLAKQQMGFPIFVDALASIGASL